MGGVFCAKGSRPFFKLLAPSHSWLGRLAAGSESDLKSYPRAEATSVRLLI
jgi:hypothetical protein